jgi:hypothetical protein
VEGRAQESTLIPRVESLLQCYGRIFATEQHPRGLGSRWDSGTKPCLGDTEATMHESEWRDWVRQYLRGLEAQIAGLRSLETRIAALEGKRRSNDARLRVGRPWEAEGVSRSAWYRRQKAVGPP